MGSQGCGTINTNGETPVNLCLNNNCAIGETIFQNKYFHKLTWKSSDGKKVNQIDHVVVNNKWRRSLNDVHTCRGTGNVSDHYLVMSRLKLCLNLNTRFDLLKLFLVDVDINSQIDCITLQGTCFNKNTDLTFYNIPGYSLNIKPLLIEYPLWCSHLFT